MGLIGNQTVLAKTCARFTNGTSTAGAYAANTRANATKPSGWRSRQIFWSESQSLPDGYTVGKAVFPALKGKAISSFTPIYGTGSIEAVLWEVKLSEAALSGTGSISQAELAVLSPSEAALSGSGAISQADLQAVASLAAALSGLGEVAASLSAVFPMEASLAGTGDIAGSTNLTGTGRLEAAITPFTELSPESLAASVWAASAADSNEAGTMGEKLNDAGSAGNPWAALVDDNNDPGTFGERVQKLLTLAKFLGLK